MLENWEILLLHQQHVLDSTANDVTKEKALAHKELLTDKDAMLSLAFLIDLQETFSVESEYYQTKGR